MFSLCACDIWAYKLKIKLHIKFNFTVQVFTAHWKACSGLPISVIIELFR